MLGFTKSKPKKDIEKRPAGKSRISIFFEIFFRKFWSICKLNMLFSLIAIPAFVILFFITGILSASITDFITNTIIPRLGSDTDIELFKIYMHIGFCLILSFAYIAFLGVGPITAGFSYVLRNYAREDHSWMCSDFFYNSKINFVQSIIVFIIDALVFLAVNISFSIYSAMPAPLSYIKYAVLFFALMYLMMHLYIYPLMITFKLSLKDIYKNAVLLAFAEAPKNILLLIILLIVHFIIPFNLLTSGYVMILLPIYILLEIFGFIGLSGFMVSFFTYPSINMLIDASEKIYNPDDEE